MAASDGDKTEVLLRMEHITKRFAGFVANDDINFEVRAGEIHALLGENGAGKTTLVNILYGLYHPDAGTISVRGERVQIRSSRQAIDHGIGMVHQHFMLVPVMTVAENIVLGMPTPSEPLLGLRAVEDSVRSLSEQYKLAVDPRAVIQDLAVGGQQRVEIIKALYRKANLLILDEPTAVLTPAEVVELFAILNRLTAQGKSVVFISHKLDEVMTISHRITVLRDGKLVGTVRREDTDKMALAEMMVGRKVVLRLNKEPACRGATPILHVEDLTVLRPKRRAALSKISLCVDQGEIFGIAGVDGNGQRELASVISGLLSPSSGRVTLHGKDVSRLGPKGLARLGVARIPEDRHKLGLVMDFSIAENLVIDSFDTPLFSRFGFLNHSRIWKHAVQMCRDYDVRPPLPRLAARLLSGGNQQKAILARELSRKPFFILAVQPTRGLDVGATEYVYQRLLAARKAGAGILLISTELDEILALSDRIGVMYEGELVGIVEREDADVPQLGLLMAGAGRARAHGVSE
jgi:ABC-type uncharacterized transport system ATPase subunit